jgi:hypothetical protein
MAQQQTDHHREQLLVVEPIGNKFQQAVAVPHTQPQYQIKVDYNWHSLKQ